MTPESFSPGGTHTPSLHCHRYSTGVPLHVRICGLLKNTIRSLNQYNTSILGGVCGQVISSNLGIRPDLSAALLWNSGESRNERKCKLLAHTSLCSGPHTFSTIRVPGWCLLLMYFCTPRGSLGPRIPARTAWHDDSVGTSGEPRSTTTITSAKTTALLHCGRYRRSHPCRWVGEIDGGWASKHLAEVHAELSARTCIMLASCILR